MISRLRDPCRPNICESLGALKRKNSENVSGYRLNTKIRPTRYWMLCRDSSVDEEPLMNVLLEKWS
jgi:hypothetical protein